MKEFFCGAVVSGCEEHFQAETEDELMAQVAAHARQAHGMDSVPPELEAQVRAKIRDV